MISIIPLNNRGPMYTLTNDALEVSILDPVADRDRMGPRYCTGGYIFQISEERGPLLSGPTYPESFNWFDGQGIPDSFSHTTLRSKKTPSSQALIPGIGLCDTSARTVLEYCDWTVHEEAHRLEFRTTQAWDDWSFSLERRVSLSGRVVFSHTRIENLGEAPVPVSWFPHPFYPLPPGEALCSLPAPVTVAPDSTYSVGGDGYLRCSDISALQAVSVRCNGAGPLTVLQHHPVRGLVAARYSFAAAHILVWGNPNTFSFEPYLEQTVGRGTALEWLAEYHF
ncbi:MAG: hypothetical protein ACOC4I_01355 [Spirochaetota bacterium]